MDKKATFHITIESMVILILGVVFLGLGLTFLTVVYLGMEKSTDHAFDELTKHRIELLMSTDRQFDLEFYSIDLEENDRKIFFMIIKNKGLFDEEWQINHTVNSLGNEVDCDKLQIAYKNNIKLRSGEDTIPPLIIKSERDINPGTCLYELTAENNEGIIETLELTVNIK